MVVEGQRTSTRSHPHPSARRMAATPLEDVELFPVAGSPGSSEAESVVGATGGAAASRSH